MADQVDEEVKSERLARLQALLVEQQQAFNASTLGRTVPILFERAGREPGQIVGRSPYLQGVWCEGPRRLIGQIAEVELTMVGTNALAGRLVEALA
jgi:tRNA-2-methylthio-N6-dimethylallyladenosine synthase